MRKSHRVPAGAAGRFSHPKIEMWPAHKIRRSKKNARTHSKRQEDKLFSTVSRLGHLDPIIVDEHGYIISGHLRYEVALRLGLSLIPVIQLTHLDEVEKRALALATNRIALDAGWNRETLAAELGDLAVLLPEEGLDLTVTGFDIAETDLIISDHSEAPSLSEENELPAAGPSVTRPGDLWLMGDNRFYCGDARDPAAFMPLMRGELATMLCADPPFNVSIRKHARSHSGRKFDEFAMASGEMSDKEYQEFSNNWVREAANNCLDGCISYIFSDWRHQRAIQDAAIAADLRQKNLAVWVKSHGGQGSFYRSQHELVSIFKKGAAPHINSFELGQHGRTRTNVWSYPGGNALNGKQSESDLHPTMKPVRMIADAMLDCSRRGSIVLDPFMGSGTTIIAAETVGRRAFGMEIDLRYADVTVRRWQKFTGRDAVLEDSGQTFDELEAERNRPSPAQKAARRTTSRKGGR
jgi:DNA modification methylase